MQMTPAMIALTSYRLALAVGTPAAKEAALHSLADVLSQMVDPAVTPRRTPRALRLVGGRDTDQQ